MLDALAYSLSKWEDLKSYLIRSPFKIKFEKSRNLNKEIEFWIIPYQIPSSPNL